MKLDYYTQLATSCIKHGDVGWSPNKVKMLKIMLEVTHNCEVHLVQNSLVRGMLSVHMNNEKKTQQTRLLQLF